MAEPTATAPDEDTSETSVSLDPLAQAFSRRLVDSAVSSNLYGVFERYCSQLARSQPARSQTDATHLEQSAIQHAAAQVADISTWTLEKLDRLFAEYVPLVENLTDTEVRDFVPNVVALLGLLDERGELQAPAEDLAAMITEVQTLEDDFFELMSDRASAVQTASLAALMRRDGVDVDNPGAVTAWSMKFHRKPTALRDRLLAEAAAELAPKPSYEAITSLRGGALLMALDSLPEAEKPSALGALIEVSGSASSAVQLISSGLIEDPDSTTVALNSIAQIARSDSSATDGILAAVTDDDVREDSRLALRALLAELGHFPSGIENDPEKIFDLLASSVDSLGLRSAARIASRVGHDAGLGDVIDLAVARRDRRALSVLESLGSCDQKGIAKNARKAAFKLRGSLGK